MAQLTGEARLRARSRPLTEDEEAAALAELRSLAAGRADLLAQVAGIFEGNQRGRAGRAAGPVGRTAVPDGWGRHRRHSRLYPGGPPLGERQAPAILRRPAGMLAMLAGAELRPADATCVLDDRGGLAAAISGICHFRNPQVSGAVIMKTYRGTARRWKRRYAVRLAVPRQGGWRLGNSSRGLRARPRRSDPAATVSRAGQADADYPGDLSSIPRRARLRYLPARPVRRCRVPRPGRATTSRAGCWPAARPAPRWPGRRTAGSGCPPRRWRRSPSRAPRRCLATPRAGITISDAIDNPMPSQLVRRGRGRSG